MTTTRGFAAPAVGLLVLGMGVGGAAAQEGFGGARSAGLVREQARHGYVPPPEAFTVEGMLSEHHFPVRDARCETELCVLAAIGHGLHRPTLTRSAYLLIEPVSGIDPARFARAPLNVGIVIDVSGSMTGEKLSWALTAAHALVDRLDERDRVSIVTFDDEARLVLPSTPVGHRLPIHAVIDSVGPGGSTNIHAGLRLGFDQVLAAHDESRQDRVFVLTDERPNVGVTDEDSFLELIGGYARRGVGLTVVGVGLDLGADLAAVMAELEGGAYFFLEGAAGIADLFGEDFDQRVTPVARRIAIRVRPGPGLRVADVFGVPGDNVTAHDDGSVTLRASTLFLDRRRTGAVLRLEPVDEPDGALRASATLEYSYLRPRGPEIFTGATQAAYDATREGAQAEFASPYHYRAYALVNFAQLLRASLAHWRYGRRVEAHRILTNARAGLDVDAWVTRDPELARERELADQILANMRQEGRLLSGAPGDVPAG